MEVRIGVRNVAREVTFESADSPEQVTAAVTQALSSPDGALRLQDDRGRTVIVPASALGYVEVGSVEKARVGFGTH